MPEINQKNVIEQSRTEVHSEDRDQIRDFRDHSVSKKDFITHCKSNDKNFERLMPLANLIPILESIVEEKKLQTLQAKKIVRAIGIIATVVAIIAGILASFKYIGDIKK